MRVLKLQASGADYAENLLERELAGTNLPSNDRALVRELIFGILRWQSTLDWLITRKTQARPQKITLQIILRLGLYQMFWLDRIPDHAAVHQSVELAKELGCGQQAGFVNAVLRSYAREKTETEQALRQLQETEPALGFSHPAWLCERWQSRWGVDSLRSLLRWNNSPPPLFARVNTLKTDARTVQEKWSEEKIQFLAREWDWTKPNELFELSALPRLDSLQSFQQGLFYIQDPSTLLAVRTLDPQPGEAILDVCAAPGGKTTFAAQLMNNQGLIMAQDLDIQRRELIRENCARLGITCVQISLASHFVNPTLSQPFDRVLVDAPCSNTGVMRRRVDLRWRIRPKELMRLQKVQLDLLDRSVNHVKVGGTLVYSTCSLEPEENQHAVQSFLSRHPNFTLEMERELLPFRDSTDGAFVARLKRISYIPMI